jgi:hypothetical protein
LYACAPGAGGVGSCAGEAKLCATCIDLPVAISQTREKVLGAARHVRRRYP